MAIGGTRIISRCRFNDYRDRGRYSHCFFWLHQFDKFPTKIILPVDGFGTSFLTTPPKNGTANALFNDFITKLEGFLRTTRTEVNISDIWLQTSPLISTSQNPPPSLNTLLNTTYADLITLDQIALVADPFIADYKAAKNGRAPFIDPAPLNRWAYGRSLANGTQQKIDAVTNKTVFMNWYRQEILGSNEETCSDAILVYPQSSGSTNYRNRYIRCVFLWMLCFVRLVVEFLNLMTSPPRAPFGFGLSRASVHAEVPDMVVPGTSYHYLPTYTRLYTKCVVYSWRGSLQLNDYWDYRASSRDTKLRCSEDLRQYKCTLLM